MGSWTYVLNRLNEKQQNPSAQPVLPRCQYWQDTISESFHERGVALS